MTRVRFWVFVVFFLISGQTGCDCGGDESEITVREEGPLVEETSGPELVAVQEPPSCPAPEPPPPCVCDEPVVEDVAAAAPGRAQQGDRPHRTPNALVGVEEYRVRRGDSLWEISADLLGSGVHWEEIYAANRSAIGDNPLNLQTGMLLAIPIRAAADL